MKIPNVILMIENSRAYGRCLLSGIARYAMNHGPWAFYRPQAFYLHPNESGQFSTEEIKLMKPDGIIMRETPNTEEIIAMGVPVILSSYNKREYAGAVHIHNDEYAVGRMAAEHLLSKGYKNFAFCGYDEFFWSNERLEGFLRYLQCVGIEDIFIKPSFKKRYNEITQREMISEIADWMVSLPTPIGLFACCDDHAQYVNEAIKISGLKSPEDFGILGVDNDDLVCDLSYPSLSSVALAAEQGGYEAAQVLDQMMHKESFNKAPLLVRPLYVEERVSTDIMAVNVQEIKDAQQFIKDNVTKPITVDDVAGHVCISRRSLERLFVRELRRSVYKEIQRTRLEQITRYLVRTDLSAGEICRIMGFSEESHLSRFFHKQKGVSLREFRKSVDRQIGKR